MSLPRTMKDFIEMKLPEDRFSTPSECMCSSERYAQTPVIVMIGSPSSVVEERATKHGAIVYFRKPSTPDEFLQLGSIVRSALSEKPGFHALPRTMEVWLAR